MLQAQFCKQHTLHYKVASGKVDSARKLDFRPGSNISNMKYRSNDPSQPPGLK